MFKEVKKTISQVLQLKISDERKEVLKKLIIYIQNKVDQNKTINLNFICTHNSRRSQFSQLWAKVAAEHYEININSFSGGVEITECNHRTISSMKRLGFKIEFTEKSNPIYRVYFSDSKEPIQLFSKLFDNSSSPKNNFITIMTCSHADDNCPFIPGAEERIPLRYKDPKEFDNTELESKKYDERSIEIASELFYVFSLIKNKTQ